MSLRFHYTCWEPSILLRSTHDTYPKIRHHLWTSLANNILIFSTVLLVTMKVNYETGFIFPQRFPNGIIQFTLCCVFLQFLWGTVWCSKVKFAFVLYSRVPNTYESNKSLRGIFSWKWIRKEYQIKVYMPSIRDGVLRSGMLLYLHLILK